jgi:hypothetical protein
VLVSCDGIPSRVEKRNRRLQICMTRPKQTATSAAWLYDLLKPHVAKVLVRDPRKSALLKDGSKSDRIYARELPELLRGNLLSPIYH